jgi:hypothetical protein
MGTKRVGWARIRSLINENTANQLSAPRKKVDNSTLNTGSDVTATLTRGQGGTHFNIDGTGDIVVNLPSPNSSNVGLHYSFLVTTAVGSGKTVVFNLNGSGTNDFQCEIVHYGNNPYPTVDLAGKTITLIATTGIGARVYMTCVQDDGSDSQWVASASADEVPTVTG